jgi:hypothetical protein
MERQTKNTDCLGQTAAVSQQTYPDTRFHWTRPVTTSPQSRTSEFDPNRYVRSLPQICHWKSHQIHTARCKTETSSCATCPFRMECIIFQPKTEPISIKFIIFRLIRIASASADGCPASFHCFRRETKTPKKFVSLPTGYHPFSHLGG